MPYLAKESWKNSLSYHGLASSPWLHIMDALGLNGTTRSLIILNGMNLSLNMSYGMNSLCTLRWLLLGLLSVLRLACRRRLILMASSKFGVLEGSSTDVTTWRLIGTGNAMGFGVTANFIGLEVWKLSPGDGLVGSPWWLSLSYPLHGRFSCSFKFFTLVFALCIQRNKSE